MLKYSIGKALIIAIFHNNLYNNIVLLKSLEWCISPQNQADNRHIHSFAEDRWHQNLVDRTLEVQPKFIQTIQKPKCSYCT